MYCTVIATTQTYHLHFTGIVQGVGFRPFVKQLATEMNLCGEVSNGTDGLHIRLNTTEAEALAFQQKIINQSPPRAVILSYTCRQIPFRTFNGFSIVESSSGEVNMPLTPDFAVCENCVEELYDSANRRFQYPFITCTQCGPRYSVTQQLPFDREHTVMQAFALCAQCAAEYNTETDRRFYAQTNSCANCGIALTLVNTNGEVLETDTQKALSQLNTFLQEGKIAAVKGLGGYLLLCDARNSETIKRLRKRKHRATKPFALLCENIAQAQLLAFCNEPEKRALCSPVAPIVLLPVKENIQEEIAFEVVAPGLNRIGIMLPCAPLLHLLVHHFGAPLVATSANISGSPIIYTNETALSALREIADVFLLHNRDILTPQDDSVIKFANHQPIIIRRSRGLAPVYFGNSGNAETPLLALGAAMKGGFTLMHRGHTYCSQYLGSTESVEAREMYRHTLTHLLHITGAKPECLLADKHPQYFTTEYAQNLAREWQIPLLTVQHHKAHAAAVLAENELLQSNEPVLCVAWDGTGYGDDEHSWGGEFFRYKKRQFDRVAHFAYFPLLLGDKMAREPRLSALSVCFTLPEAETLLQNKFTSTEWNLYRALLQNETQPLTSSCGRLFDALASLLQLCDKQHYEGEAALLLETEAGKYLQRYGSTEIKKTLPEIPVSPTLPVQQIFEILLQDIVNGKEPGWVALKFHYMLAQMAATVAKAENLNRIAFSGGVFQNALLVQCLHEMLEPEHSLFFHRQLSPNDENIAFGQAVYYQLNIDNLRQPEATTMVPAYT